ncbi:MAG: hypothetical protein P9L91_10805, partial [Candidatus Zophobacter franzmannii]|nr:hypothetical protein [Candidatus Zophobacter franzmannii]
MKFAVITLFLFSLLFPLIADGANTSGGALMIVPNQFVDTGDLIDNTNNNNMRGRDEWWFINATVPRTNVDIQAVFDGWDGYLYVYDENLNQIASNDDGPSGVYESQIVMDMDNSITYYICIDEFSASTGTRTFTLHVNADIIWDPPPSPGPISNVSPIDGAIEQPLNTVLAWDFGNNTEFYDLYLDTVDPPITIIVDNAIAEGSGSYNPVSFAQNTVYYWQVISRNTISRLETASSIYSFQTTFGDDIVEIGNGTETNLSLPIEPYWGYSYSQSIYLQEEINTPNSRIETIWYHYNQAGTLSHSQDWVIYMGHTDFVAFENGNDWVPASELTEVY